MGGGASLKPGCFFSKLTFDGTLRQAQGMLLKTILRLGLDQRILPHFPMIHKKSLTVSLGSPKGGQAFIFLRLYSLCSSSHRGEKYLRQGDGQGGIY